MKIPITNEDLRTWFRQKWVRMDTKGNIKGDCAREEGEGKPKCLPLAKASSMSKTDRAAAVKRKRREDPIADRFGKGGKPINVRTEKMDLEEENKPTKPDLWARAKALAKSKFDVYPSAYANGWAAKWYKSKGGSWKSVSEGIDDEGGMAKGDLETIASKAKELSKMMKKNKQLDAWVQSKITKADDYIGSVHDFLKNGKQEVDEQMQKKTFFTLREQLDSVCIDCDDSLYGSVEEDFEPTGEEQYENWDLQESTYSYDPFKSITKFNTTSKGHTVVGITKDEQGRKGANILKHKSGGYFASPGSLTRPEGDIHKTPEEAAKAFHTKRNEKLVEAETPLSYMLKNPGKKVPFHLDPNRPFDPDMPKKNPVAKAGKYGQGFSTAKHLAKQGMASVSKKKIKETHDQAYQSSYGDNNAIDILQNWKNEVPAQYAEHLMNTFGEPDDITSDLVIWKNTDGFKRIEIKDEYVMHTSPEPHYDYCYCFIDLKVPHMLATSLADCSESILIDFLKNEVGARCASLAANAVTLNFVMDVVAGRAKPTKQEYESRIMKMHDAFDQGKTFKIDWWPDESHDTDPNNPYYAEDTEGDLYEAKNLAQQAAIAIAMKKAGIPPKNVDEAKYQKLTPRQKFTNSLARAGYDVNASSKRIQDLLAKQKKEREEREKQSVAEGAKWRKHPDAYDVDDEGNKTPRNPNSSKFGYDPLQRRADTANDAKTSKGKVSALKTSLKMAKGQKGVAEGIELQEAEKNGRTVQLNKPFRTSDGKGKFAVYTKNDKGNVVKVNFGDTTGLTIKTGNPERRRSFRARHNCDDPGPRYKARFWACKSWSKDTVSAGLGT